MTKTVAGGVPFLALAVARRCMAWHDTVARREEERASREIQ